MIIRKRSSTVWLILFGILTLQGCAIFSSSSSAPARPKVLAIEVNKRKAVELAKEFAAGQGFSDEFNVKKPSKVTRQLAIAKPPYWVWQVFFPAKNESTLKFYKKTFLLIEVNSTDGSIGEWGRR